MQKGTISDADEMASQFTRLIDDLAYARTFYPGSRATQYINALASRIYLSIYRNRKEEKNRLLLFWKQDVPEAVYRRRRDIQFALGVFVLFFSVGFFSAGEDEYFIREVLGEQYVELTEQNIESGNPFGIYASENPLYMFVRIMLNNIMVAFSYFFRGILLGIPSIVALGREAIRIGTFEQMFFQKGFGVQSVTTVLIHGLLELTAIIISCGAGLAMGKSVLFPGPGTRMAALREGVKDGVKIIIGMIPVFTMAALLEGYVTRHYKMPVLFSLSILAASALLIIWYFMIYPLRLHKRKTTGVTHHD